MYENSYNIFTRDQTLLIYKEFSNDLVNISSENLESIVTKFTKNDIIIDNESLYNIILKACIIRSHKIELLMSFLKEIEQRTNKDQFKSFKDMTLNNLRKTNVLEVRFIVRYLYYIKELNREQIIPYIKNKKGQIKDKFKDILFDLIEYDKKNNTIDISCLKMNFETNDSFSNYNYDKFLQYVINGSNPDAIYQAIINDDLETFKKEIIKKSSDLSFNSSICFSILERSSEAFNCITNYIDAAAFFGSEKIFNYILLNIDKKENISEITFFLAACGGNHNIIHKLYDNVDLDNAILQQGVIGSISHHNNEVFEWLIENYYHDFETLEAQSFEKRLLIFAINYNNYDALFYLFSIGIDYQPMFLFSMYNDDFYLAKLSLKLQYNCNNSCKMEKHNHSPYVYQYEGILLNFLKCLFLLQLKKIKLILLKLF